jgi:DNA-directed RNA polymerase subunit RPC12/RpoP
MTTETYRCQYCGADFRDHPHLEEHYAREHEGQGGTTPGGTNFVREAEGATTPGGTNFVCGQCGERFESSGLMEVHILEIHPR